MKHSIEITTIGAMVINRALLEYSSKSTTPFDDVLTSKEVMDIINKTVASDLNRREKR